MAPGDDARGRARGAARRARRGAFAPHYFATPAALRRWLEARHATAGVLWVGFHKRATGRPSLAWPESVDEALCFGWIDGVRRPVDATRYAIRFTPRRATSTWSAVNVRRARALIADGRMRPAGLAAFERRREERPAADEPGSRVEALAPRYAAAFRRVRAAWAWYQGRPPWCRRLTARWVMSAKQEATRARRLRALIEDCAAGRPVGPLRRQAPPAGPARGARTGPAR
uniref:Bacteriocin-protection protein n=1 Tax=Eiseniibacteriota bacterium TaxID=2212470 RepID=A0A832ML63_UNCEI